MEHKIGETFEYDGVSIKVEYGNLCFGCYFSKEGIYCYDKNVRNIIGRCGFHHRGDGRNVIFKQVDSNTNKTN